MSFQKIFAQNSSPQNANTQQSVFQKNLQSTSSTDATSKSSKSSASLKSSKTSAATNASAASKASRIPASSTLRSASKSNSGSSQEPLDPQTPSRGRILMEEAQVYSKPDFDSEVIDSLSAGSVWNISSKVYGPFYKIKIKSGAYGYISDVDIKPFKSGRKEASESVNAANSNTNKTNPTEEIPSSSNSSKKVKSLIWSSYGGLNLYYVPYKEQTMGRSFTENTWFYGFKSVGPDRISEDPSVTEFNILVSPKAPSYYRNATGYSTTGMIIYTDYIFNFALLSRKNVIIYYGAGPLLKYSHIETSLLDTGTQKKIDYNLDDFSLGAALVLGTGVRLGLFSFRCELKYLWEVQSTLSGGFSLLYNL